MTQKEFEDRTGLKPTPEEFNNIHSLYMNTEMDKDDFCKDFKEHGVSKIVKEVNNVAVRLQAKNNEVSELVDFLIGKACAYDDTDFYDYAVKMVGQKEVTLRKVKGCLPLWRDDIEFIAMNLK